MAKKISSVLGVDIGSRHIKIAEVKLQGREPTVTALAMGDTPEGAVDHTGVYDAEAVAGAIKTLASQAGATSQHAVASIAGQASVVVRTLPVPRMNENELKEHMQWEVQRNIPFAESNVQYDYRALELDEPGSNEVDVVLAISPQSAIDTMVSIFKKAGKQLAAIDVEPLGLGRSLATSYEDLAGQTVCVIDIGHKTTSINIYKEGRPLMPRQVPFGGESFTRAIADSLGVSFEEAEQIKISSAEIPAGASIGAASAFGAAPETQQFAAYNPFADDQYVAPVEPTPVGAAHIEEPGEGAEATAPAPPEPVVTVPAAVDDGEKTRIFNALATALEEFVSETRRSIDFFRSNKGQDVSKIILCGGGAKLKGLAAFVQSTIGISTEVLDPVRNITVNAKRLEGDVLEHNREEFAVAVGNGLHICFE